jgi:hypothetical protein
VNITGHTNPHTYTPDRVDRTYPDPLRAAPPADGHSLGWHLIRWTLIGGAATVLLMLSALGIALIAAVIVGKIALTTERFLD